jgi:hypothetical protein
MTNSPYETGMEARPEAAAPAVPRPKVWPWFVVYCVLNVLTGIAGAILGLYGSMLDMETVRSWSPQFIDDETAMVLKFQIGFWGLSTLFYSLFYVAAPFLPRRPWAWVLDLVLIVMGVLTLLFLPLALPLLFFWLKRNVQDWFGIKPWEPRY